jgi:hypothetical protein
MRPALVAIGLGCIVAAVGGPSSLGSFAFISREILWVTAVSAAAGGALMGWFALRELSSSSPKYRTSRQRSARRLSLGIVGIAVLLVVGLRALTTSNPMLGSVIFGAFGGLMLVGAALPTRALIRPSG